MMPFKSSLLKSIQKESWDAFESIRNIRRDLHAHPELSGKEIHTSDTLAKHLNQLGLEIHRKIGGYGLFADLITDAGKPTVAFRVDMDALPIQEVNQVPYRSKIPGIMHACGHDVHSAIGIGVAAVLSKISEQLPVNIRFIFQPEEEEITGAKRMIHAGALKNPKPKAIFGLHVAPLPVGQIAWTEGLFLAGFDHYLVAITPRKETQRSFTQLDLIARRCIQTILGMNHWQLPETWEDMQAFWQHLKDPPDSLKNFIIYDASLDPENSDLWHGQFGVGVKAANSHLRRLALGRIRAAVNRICRMTKTNYRIEPMGSMIDMRNDPKLVQSTLPALESALGKENLVHLKAAFPFNCEDFAYYTKDIPGAMFWLGGANPIAGKYALLHTPDFDVDETCLVTGTTAMAAILIEALNFQP